MGSFGSTRWRGHQAATVLEHCRSLSMRHVLYVDRGSLGCRLLRDLAYRVVRDGSGEPYLLEAEYRAGFVWVQRELEIATVVTAAGIPQRLWRCPIEAEDGTVCGRLVRVLYRPPSGMEFGCRHCHRLVYWRNQIRDKNSYRRTALIHAQGEDLPETPVHAWGSRSRAPGHHARHPLGRGGEPQCAVARRIWRGSRYPTALEMQADHRAFPRTSRDGDRAQQHSAGHSH